MSSTLPKPQELRQGAERDCSVPVFSRLAGIPEDQVRLDLPDAAKGKISVEQWKGWLESKRFEVLERTGGPDDILPCAHLVGPVALRSNEDCHWIFRDADGDVHDPSEVFQHMPANDTRMKDLSVYDQKILTLSVSRRR